jgi:cysteine-rich repeat protein
VKRSSKCHNDCGDGFQTREEQCDLGAASNATPTPYGGCSATCTLGDYCGDSTPNPPSETCDDGANLTPYTVAKSTTSCGPGCMTPAYCGDEIVQGAYNERCDNGAANTNDANAYGNCTTTCTFGARCGDGTVQAAHGEVCDNGFNAASYVAHPSPTDCAPGCKQPRSCGDGNVDYPFEQCDNAAANATPAVYGGCTANCTLGPRCGDGTVQAGEGCDDGNRKNGDGCSAACVQESHGPN